MAIVTDLAALNREVTTRMKAIYGDRLAEIILFGSYARGDFDEESDVDYLIALHDENVSPFMEVKYTRPVLSDLYLSMGADVSAVVVSRSQLIASARPFFKEVRKHGRPIYD